MKKLLDAHAKTAEERQTLSERLEKEAVERRKIEKTKGMLLGKLQAMEAKLIQVKRQPRLRMDAHLTWHVDESLSLRFRCWKCLKT